MYVYVECSDTLYVILLCYLNRVHILYVYCIKVALDSVRIEYTTDVNILTPSQVALLGSILCHNVFVIYS